MSDQSPNQEQSVRPGRPETLRALLMPFLLTAIIMVVDQVTKALIVAFVEPIETSGRIIPVLGDFLRIIRTQNIGVAFSLGRGLSEPVRRVLFIVLPLLVLGGLLVYYFRSGEFTRLQRWAVAGIVGGGLGNQVDRIFRAAGVIDWVDINFYGIFGWQRFPTWNVADGSITVCSILLLISIFVQERRRTILAKQATAAHQAADSSGSGRPGAAGRSDGASLNGEESHE